MAVYRLAFRFKRIEAVGPRGATNADPADPVALRIVTTPADDSSFIIEDIVAGAATRSRLWRATTGTWVFQLDPRFYEAGKQYTARAEFQMNAGNDNVSRLHFTWDPMPETPREPDGIVVSGALAGIAGTPISDSRLIVEQYRDVQTLNQRAGSVDVVTDAFGNWSIELNRNQIYRFVFGDVSRMIRTPDAAQATLAAIPDFQPAADPAANLDPFGYPRP